MPEFIEEIKAFREHDRSAEGFELLTSEQSILLGIVGLQNGSNRCCWDWGYYFTNPSSNLDEFIGAELLSVVLSNTCLFDTAFLGDTDVNANYVNLITNRGIMQFAAWHDVSLRTNHSPLIMKVDCFQLRSERVA